LCSKRSMRQRDACGYRAFVYVAGDPSAAQIANNNVAAER
jgi:hypothetical protein